MIDKFTTGRTGSQATSVSLADDDRARIPFAVISVVLLVSSATIVAAMTLRDQPDEPEIDVESAVDRTEASSQTVVRDAAVSALDTAARKPVTDPNLDNPAGAALAYGEGSVFERYVRLRIYLEVERRLSTVSRRAGDDTYTSVSLPSVEPTNDESDVSEGEITVWKAINRVELTNGTEGEDLEPGQINVTVEDINVSVVRDGEVIETRKETVSVTVASSVFVLHNRTQVYEDRLNAGLLDGDGYRGFGRRFAARIYPYTYAKAIFENFMATGPTEPYAFDNIINNSDATVLANDAIFGIQENVYGTTDPGSDRVMKWAWGCLAIRNLKTLYQSWAEKTGDGGEGEGETNFSEYLAERGIGLSVEKTDDVADSACDALRIIFGGYEGEDRTVEEVLYEVIPSNVTQVMQMVKDAATGDLADDDISSDGREVRTDGGKLQINVSEFSRPAVEEVTGGSYDPRAETDGGDEDSIYGGATDGEDEDCAGEDPSGFECQFDAAEIAEAIVEVYEVEVGARVDSTDTDGEKPDLEPPGPEWEETYSDMDVVDTDTDAELREADYEGTEERRRDLHHVTVAVTKTYELTKTWETDPCEDDPNETCTKTRTETETSDVTYTVELGVWAEHSPGSDVEERGIANAYVPGGDPAPVGNYEEAVEESKERILGATDADELEAKIDPDLVESTSDLEDQIIETRTATIENETLYDGEVWAWVKEQVRKLHHDVAGTEDEFEDPVDDRIHFDPVKVNRTELLETNPHDTLKDWVEANKTRIVYRDVGDSYATVPDKLRAEARLAYYEALIDWIERAKTKTDEQTTAVKDEYDGAEKGQEYRDGPPESAGDESGWGHDFPLRDGVTISIDASPTYLTIEPVTRDQVPSVRTADGGAESIPTSGATHAPMALRDWNLMPNPGIPIVPIPGYWYASINVWELQFRANYSRFEVSASGEGPATDASTTYVRQRQTVSLEIGGEDVHVGDVEPVGFSNNIPVAVLAPGQQTNPKGSWGAGDFVTREDAKGELVEKITGLVSDPVGFVSDPRGEIEDSVEEHFFSIECSETWDYAGAGYEGEPRAEEVNC